MYRYINFVFLYYVDILIICTKKTGMILAKNIIRYRSVFRVQHDFRAKFVTLKFCEVLKIISFMYLYDKHKPTAFLYAVFMCTIKLWTKDY